MKNFINKALIAGMGIAALAATSCSEDYLETAPTASVGTATALGSTENAMKVLNGIAQSMVSQQYMGTQGNCGENEVISHMENYPCQDYLYNYYAAGWDVIHNQEYHLNVNSTYDRYAWYYYYNLIGQANSVIANIDGAEGTDAEKAFIKAAGLTFRAYAYEKLMHYYSFRYEDSEGGSIKVLPLRLDESTGDLALSTYNEVYAQIYKDCQEAIALYDESGMDRPGGQYWLPNKNVVEAVYSRAALQSHDWATASEHARKAMNGYPLMSNAEYAAGFTAPTSEWILGGYGSSEENKWYWTYGTQFSCNGYYSASTACGAGAIGRELINRIPNSDFRKSLFLTEDKFPDYDWSASNPDKYYQTNGIIGLTPQYAETLEEYEELLAIYDPNDVYSQVEAYINSKAIAGLPAPYEAGYYYLGGQMKFWVVDRPGVHCFPFIRSSEMVLNIAEAEYRLGNAAKAQAALVELNATSGRNPGYTCSLTGDALWNEIMDYRSFELWGEGFQWSDFKRWNRAIVRKTIADGGNAHQAIAKTIAPDFGNKWTWDIPNDEKEYNGAIATGAPEAQ